ncbi:hypothetical protein MTR67_004769 [Solanum verrucosum]|uniref:Uncharacterized protein n=1 Tax=Solanum verrucosum TaxID=315347 RepID=A0AAF0PUI9_SOLVR|nr:hypothetical protein MTR67_004769 [Solanum verrucosum]
MVGFAVVVLFGFTGCFGRFQQGRRWFSGRGVVGSKLLLASSALRRRKRGLRWFAGKFSGEGSGRERQ